MVGALCSFALQTTIPQFSVIAIECFERIQDSFDPLALRNSALRFSASRYREQLFSFLDTVLAHSGTSSARSVA